MKIGKLGTLLYPPLSKSLPPGEGESVIPSPLIGESQGEGVFLLFS